MRKIILASASKHRRAIFKKLGVPFTVAQSNYTEDLTLRMAPRQLAMHLALKKAESVARKHKDAIVIGADTIAVLGKRVIGKPASLKDAARTLRLLSGKLHHAITGVAIIDTREGIVRTRAAITKVYFRKLTREEIYRYVKTGEPLGKAGAYGIQDTGNILVEKINGDFYNVAGLPMALLLRELREFGIL